MLKLLGKGSSREVFDLGNALVLKKSYTEAGIEQNKAEVYDRKIKDLGTRVYSWAEDFSFIVVEKATKATEDDFLKFTGKPFSFTRDFIFSVRKFVLYKKPLDISYAQITEKNVFYEMLYRYLVESKLNKLNTCVDFGKISSWGIVNRDNSKRLVIIDYGLSDAIYEKYYRKRN